MRLLECVGEDEFVLTKDLLGDDEIPLYAILSHTWKDGEEVSFSEFKDGTGKIKEGYQKIQFCGQQTRRDGLRYFWVDTCCINKSDHVELQDAINSMFRWYQNATRCYVYLSDVSMNKRKVSHQDSIYTWEPAFRASRWFTRGWTLQELLAPRSIKFFSQEGQQLGKKRTLELQISEITGIPPRALQDIPLCDFEVDERLSWAKHRKTTRKEDKAYSLLGLFGIYMPLLYGEGEENAFKRLREEIKKSSQALVHNYAVQLEKEAHICIKDLRLTDPRYDKKRIEETKGGLLEDSYHWVLDNAEYQQWRDEQQSRLLWIKGDPGKGKTMLLCGIANELKRSISSTDLLSYFFCQATDSRINTATAVLRGLMYLLVDQQPSLVSHIKKKHDNAGKNLFEDANAFVALSDIFSSMLEDSSIGKAYLIVDALDECITDLPKLLDLMVQKSSESSRVKWIVSSRNLPSIQERLERARQKVKLSLELNAASVSAAVHFYIRHRVDQLALEKNYNEREKCAVLSHLTSNANDTFLWVALVCQNLRKMSRWNVVTKLKAFPPGLDNLYEQMIQHISISEDAILCKHILALIATVYRPITLEELTSLSEMLNIANDFVFLQDVISLCGSFLTVRSGTVYFVHQSAKDFLSTQTVSEIFPSGMEEVHHAILSKSLQVLSNTLRRDIYSLGAPGYSVDQVVQPDPDPLAASRYSCMYWIDHLCDWAPSSSVNHMVTLKDGGVVDSFLREKYLYWLEALSLCRGISKGVVSIAKLEAFIKELPVRPLVKEVVQDARRFILYHKSVIENNPLQLYASALVFSPRQSIIRTIFKEEEPNGIIIKPAMQNKWSSCLQTLEGHSSEVNSVAFSPDSTRLASASWDSTVKVWDAHSGECLQTLEGHSSEVNSVAFSPDSTRLASASSDSTVKVWDAHSGECLQTLEGHSSEVNSVAFSPDSTRLASASWDRTVKVWDAHSCECLQTLEVEKPVYSISFDSSDSSYRYLHTSGGVIDISAGPISTRASISAEPQNPQCQSLGLSVAGKWITHNSKNILWLPSEYRPYCSAVSGDVIAVGVGNGRVWMCRVQSLS